MRFCQNNPQIILKAAIVLALSITAIGLCTTQLSKNPTTSAGQAIARQRQQRDFWFYENQLEVRLFGPTDPNLFN